jgi:T5SS/PEP-CTERM-associated repeat protein
LEGFGGYVAGVLNTDGGIIGNSAISHSNRVSVSGSAFFGSVSHWNMTGDLIVGNTGSFNQLSVGSLVQNNAGYVGYDVTSSNNLVLVSGPPPPLWGLVGQWNNSGNLYVGYAGSGNQVTNNGGRLLNIDGFIGALATASNNAVTLTGGSLWQNAGTLYVGDAGAGNLLTINDNGTVVASNAIIGAQESAGMSNAIIITVGVSGGNLVVTNATANGTLEVRRGTLTLNGGTLTADRLYATNGASSVINFNGGTVTAGQLLFSGVTNMISFNGGTLNSGASTVNNGSEFRVGNGTSAATLNLQGGVHTFANGLFINTNALLTGAGEITNAITVAGTIAPGNSAGTITGSSDLTLLNSAQVVMENGDHIHVAGTLDFGGTLTVTQTGDQDLFDFGGATGAFSQTNLPALGSGTLYWNTSALYTSGEIFVDSKSWKAARMISPAHDTTLKSSVVTFV